MDTVDTVSSFIAASRRQARQLAAAFRAAPEVDAGLALAAFVSLLLNPVVSGADPSFWSAMLAAATSLPLMLRRRYPVGVLTVVTAGVLACLAVFKPDQAAVPVMMVAVYTVGEQGRRTRSLLIGAALAPLVVIAVVISSRHGFQFDVMVASLALVLVALAAGDARRGRLALVRAAAEEAEREREAAAQHQFDERRLRLAHELHDTVAHALVAINVRAAAAAHLQRNAPGENLTALEEIKRTSADALADLRSTLRTLRSAADEAPLRPAQSLADLPDLVDGLAGAGVAVELKIAAMPETLPAAIGHAGYRIIQEALTNVLRHSSARHAVVSVCLAGDTLTIEVTNDGQAKARHPATAGHGLQGMAERAAALGGRCEAGVAPDGGWRVWASLPTGT
jgi:signal transduction histidine kinase